MGNQRIILAAAALILASCGALSGENGNSLGGPVILIGDFTDRCDNGVFAWTEKRTPSLDATLSQDGGNITVQQGKFILKGTIENTTQVTLSGNHFLDFEGLGSLSFTGTLDTGSGQIRGAVSGDYCINSMECCTHTASSTLDIQR